MLVLTICLFYSIHVLLNQNLLAEAAKDLLTYEATESISQPEVNILVGYNSVNKGNKQSITVDVFDSQSNQGLAEIVIDGTATYISGLPT